MVHSNTELLIDYWRGRLGDARVPARSTIDPTDFPALLPVVFIAERRPSGDVLFRLAGETVAELHGGPLAGVSLLALWRHDHRRPLLAALQASLTDGRPLVVGAAPEGSEGRLELLFAPLSGPDGRADRFLGLYQPLAGPLAAPLKPLTLINLAGAPVRAATGPRLAAIDGRLIA